MVYIVCPGRRPRSSTNRRHCMYYVSEKKSGYRGKMSITPPSERRCSHTGCTRNDFAWLPIVVTVGRHAEVGTNCRSKDRRTWRFDLWNGNVKTERFDASNDRYGSERVTATAEPFDIGRESTGHTGRETLCRAERYKTARRCTQENESKLANAVTG